MMGNEKCRQSLAEPCRTTMALVNAAKVIVIAANPIQIPVLGALESYGFTRCNPRGVETVGGGCVVAILLPRSSSYLRALFVSAPENSALRSLRSILQCRIDRDR